MHRRVYVWCTMPWTQPYHRIPRNYERAHSTRFMVTRKATGKGYVWDEYNQRYRAEQLGALFQILSAGRGTRIVLQLRT